MAYTRHLVAGALSLTQLAGVGQWKRIEPGIALQFCPNGHVLKDCPFGTTTGNTHHLGIGNQVNPLDKASNIYQMVTAGSPTIDQSANPPLQFQQLTRIAHIHPAFFEQCVGESENR